MSSWSAGWEEAGTTGTFSGAGYDSHGEVPGLYSRRDESSEMVSLVDAGICVTAACGGRMRAILMPICLSSASCIPGTVLSASLDTTSQDLTSP